MMFDLLVILCALASFSQTMAAPLWDFTLYYAPVDAFNARFSCPDGSVFARASEPEAPPILTMLCANLPGGCWVGNMIIADTCASWVSSEVYRDCFTALPYVCMAPKQPSPPANAVPLWDFTVCYSPVDAGTAHESCPPGSVPAQVLAPQAPPVLTSLCANLPGGCWVDDLVIADQCASWMSSEVYRNCSMLLPYVCMAPRSPPPDAPSPPLPPPGKTSITLNNQVFTLVTTSVEARTALVDGCPAGAMLAGLGILATKSAMSQLCVTQPAGCWVNPDTINGMCAYYQFQGQYMAQLYGSCFTLRPYVCAATVLTTSPPGPPTPRPRPPRPSPPPGATSSVTLDGQVFTLVATAVDARAALVGGCPTGALLAGLGTTAANRALGRLCATQADGCWVNADTINGMCAYYRSTGTAPPAALYGSCFVPRQYVCVATASAGSTPAPPKPSPPKPGPSPLPSGLPSPPRPPPSPGVTSLLLDSQIAWFFNAQVDMRTALVGGCPAGATLAGLGSRASYLALAQLCANSPDGCWVNNDTVDGLCSCYRLNQFGSFMAQFCNCFELRAYVCLSVAPPPLERK